MTPKTKTIYQRAGEMLGLFQERMPGCDIALALVSKPRLIFEYRIMKWEGGNVRSVIHCISGQTLWSMRALEEYAGVHAQLMRTSLENQAGETIPAKPPDWEDDDGSGYDNLVNPYRSSSKLAMEHRGATPDEMEAEARVRGRKDIRDKDGNPVDLSKAKAQPINWPEPKQEPKDAAE